MTAARKPSGLGRGLDALLADEPVRLTGKTSDPRGRASLPIEFLKPNREQPRLNFDKDAIAELAHSIRAHGLLQPILVRPLGPDSYEIVAGERRWRAAQAAQLHEVPVIIRELSDDASAEIALIENVQRVDLAPLEEARAYERLIKTYGRTPEEIAKAVGKSRSHVTNAVRLLELPSPVFAALEKGEITAGHARALYDAPNPEALLAAIVEKGASVRQTEGLVRAAHEFKAGRTDAFTPSRRDLRDAFRTRTPGLGTIGSAPNPSAKSSVEKSSVRGKDADTRALEKDLQAALGLDVELRHNPKGYGVMVIGYENLDQLDEICRRLLGTKV